MPGIITVGGRAFGQNLPIAFANMMGYTGGVALGAVIHTVMPMVRMTPGRRIRRAKKKARRGAHR